MKLLLLLSIAFAKEVGLQTQEILDTMNRNVGPIARCYERELKTYPALEGRMITDIEIDRRGKVLKALVESSDLGNEELEKCVTDTVLKLQFPKPRGKVAVRVRYPFRFTQNLKR